MRKVGISRLVVSTLGRTYKVRVGISQGWLNEWYWCSTFLRAPKNRWDWKLDWTIWRERLRADDNTVDEKNTKRKTLIKLLKCHCYWSDGSVLSEYPYVKSRRFPFSVFSVRRNKKNMPNIVFHFVSVIIWNQWMTPLRVLRVNEGRRSFTFRDHQNAFNQWYCPWWSGLWLDQSPVSTSLSPFKLLLVKQSSFQLHNKACSCVRIFHIKKH